MQANQATPRVCVAWFACNQDLPQHLTLRQLNDYLPVLAHYYDLPAELFTDLEKSLRIILVLIYSINQYMKQSPVLISKRYVNHHLKQVKNWYQYSKDEFQQ